MSFGFMAFDPYLTFAKEEKGFKEKIFLKADGTATETYYGKSRDGRGYLSALWRIGRDSYATVAERFEYEPTVQDFKEIAEYIKKVEKDSAPFVQYMIEEGRLTLYQDRDSPPVNNVFEVLNDAPDGWLLEILMRVQSPSVVSGHLKAEDLEDFEFLLSAAAVMYISSYIIAEQLGADDLDVFYDVIQTNFASAKLYRNTIDTASDAKSSTGRRSAVARHKKTNDSKVAAQAEWASVGEKLSSRAAFSRLNHKKYDVTERTLYSWITEYERSRS
ncbi:hypothetical protein C4K29_2078 [Pseudomonas chlororaphis subsp. piscium]|uniref:hypothetical protein n=1 Tax=Pseudomonas chlororaphis TaxID=587753 RepID=UPI000F573BF7|nr:hypothetical protein [Pseudomonas chlororaphis]AZC88381.1 hypothetical protein C4K29_2078 [Pseudomonas chlororaphis subsp. piscium]